MVEVQLEFDESVFEQIKNIAAQQSCSIADFIKECVQLRLKTLRQNDAILSLSGKYRSGIGDLSANHDAYLKNGW